LEVRATKYSNLKWVNNKQSLDALMSVCDLKKNDHVLDLGCGTGAVSKAMFDKVNSIVAVDKSIDMLKKFEIPETKTSVHIDVFDAQEDMLDDRFSLIVSRMLFHHLTKFKKVFKNCYNMLLPNGRLVIQEGGVLPKRFTTVSTWYADMMKLKENRHNFNIEELMGYYADAGFKDIKTKVIIDKNFSINDWLENSGQDTVTQTLVYNLHLNAPKEIKEFYNMRIRKNKIFINSHTLIIKGTK
jgi:cyclopropane fatty-acyl-phospholipid synthase-like methyltransferase